MKQKDMRILSMLRGDCRMSLTDISRKTSIPVSTIYDRLKLFNRSIIKKNSALIDFSKIGYVVKTHILFCVERSQKEVFADYLGKQHNVNSLYRINNGFDFLAEVLCRDINELELFMDTLQLKFKIKDKKTFFIISELKREAFLEDCSLLEATDD
ncbi:Lrp/AsnC family transcriptional regulator [Candidatus Woesearchaeota archaeon]|nr:Lrp/AsnC family transcriptional regulator [Candidatus Woesearchaeota archaeon]